MKKAVIVGVDHFHGAMVDYYLDELENLATSLSIEVIKRFKQKDKQSSTPFKIGKGKVEEIKESLHVEPVDYIIFNEELTNTQIRNLEEVLDCAVIDRTMLILETFTKRAKTKEAMLQVEIAQLRYLKPRLSALRSSFEQQQGGIGQKGPGEKKLELDRRKIDKEIKTLKSQLNNIVKTRKINRQKRTESSLKNIAVVGYTNAGKSTLLNTLIDHSHHHKEENNLKTENRLFATLETATRKIQLKDKKPFTITDTIGFIAQLPHELVDSFKATLEEIKEADLLIHVIDFSHPYYLDQIQTTETVLKELGVDQIETLYVFNKIDLSNEFIPNNYTPAVKISLKDKTNIDLLISKINELLFKDDTICVYRIPQNRGDIVSLLNETAEMIDQRYDDDDVIIKARVDKALKSKLKSFES